MTFIAPFCLNLSCFLYLIFFIPQLFHNAQPHHTKQLSFYFHAFLLLTTIADIYYAFIIIQEWQYRLVSITMINCLFYQHFQLYRQNTCPHINLKLHGLSSLSLGLLVLWVSVIQHPSHHLLLGLTMGWLERLGNTLCILSQLIKNFKQKSAQALSQYYLWIWLVASGCDTLSAWHFDWGACSLYGSPLAIMLILINLFQSYTYQNCPSDH